MKKSTVYAMMLMVALVCFPFHGNASEPVTGEPVKTEMPAEIKAKLDRLEEIKNMDKSELTRAEKRALRKEVRAIKGEVAAAKGGVYLSVGAIIIIILLLILLL